MLSTSSAEQIEGLFSYIVRLARRHDLVAIIKVKDLYKVVYSARVDIEALADLRELDVYHLITLGKTTKSKLTAAQKDELLVYIKECNVQLN